MAFGHSELARETDFLVVLVSYHEKGDEFFNPATGKSCSIPLLECLVTANRFARVQVAVHTRIDLVQHIGLVWAGSCRRRTGQVGRMRRT